MVGHENISRVMRLGKESPAEDYYQGLWGAETLDGHYGVAVEGLIEVLRGDRRIFHTRPFKLYEAPEGTKVSFEPGQQKPQGEHLIGLRLNGPVVGMNATFDHFPDGIVAVNYTMVTCEPDRDVFKIERGEEPDTVATLPPNSLNGNLGEFEDEIVAATAGTYLQLVLAGMRIAGQFGTEIGGLVPVPGTTPKPLDQPAVVSTQGLVIA